MTDPKGNSEFCFPETLNVPGGKEHQGWGKQISLFLAGPVIMCLFYIVGYNLKQCQKWKEHIKNSKMTKFEIPGIKE